MYGRVSISTALFLGDSIIIAFSLRVASWLRPQLGFGKPIATEHVWLPGVVYGFALVVWAVEFTFTGVYDLRRNLGFADEIYRLIVAHFLSTLAFAGVLYFSFREISRLQVLSFALVSWLLLFGYRAVLRIFLHYVGDKRYGSRRVLVVGSSVAGQEVAHAIGASEWTGLKLVGHVDDSSIGIEMGCTHLGALAETVEVVQRHRSNELIFALPRHAHAQLANLVVGLHQLKVNVRWCPIFSTWSLRAPW
jgi:FlaA1/EpsC-like NDP-sugar epimerase